MRVSLKMLVFIIGGAYGRDLLVELRDEIGDECDGCVDSSSEAPEKILESILRDMVSDSEGVRLGDFRLPTLGPDDLKDCSFEYSIGRTKTLTLCSYKIIDERQLRMLGRQYDFTQAHYLPFLHDRFEFYPDEEASCARVYLTTVRLLNEEKRFQRVDRSGTIVGIYSRQDNSVYITDEVFTSQGSTDFVHELAHWFNALLGVALEGNTVNESLAREFEEYYKTHFDST